MKKIDLTGQRFGRLIVQGRSDKPTSTRIYWDCLCDCGTVKAIQSAHLRSRTEGTKSCGCLMIEAAKITGSNSATHGHRKRGNTTSTYECWKAAKSRCENPNDKQYKNYGGRGIKFCERWGEFENFLADMGECPPGLTLDRINNDGNYEPGNCRWATWKEQARNTRRNRLITFRGETKCVAEWAEVVGLNTYTLWSRLKVGWSVERALLTPRTSRWGI